VARPVRCGFSPSLPDVDAPAPHRTGDDITSSSAVLHDPVLHLAGIDPSIEADAAAIIAQTTLTEPQRAILDFERRWWRQAGAKEQAIRDNFEMSPTRYYQSLNALLDLPQAQSYDPMLVHRLRRLRTSAPRARRLS
jgi:hypothetical protein